MVQARRRQPQQRDRPLPKRQRSPNRRTLPPPSTFEDLDNGTLNRILHAIAAGLADGDRYSDDNAAKNRAAWKAVKIHAPTKTETQCKDVIRQWVKSGLLVRKLYENKGQRRATMGLKVNNAKRPGTRIET
jgi:hypothetical protein